MSKKSNKKIIQIITACALALVLIVATSFFDDSSTALAKARRHGGKSSGGTCSNTCGPFTTTKAGTDYTFTAGAQYRCERGFPGWGCELLKNEAIARLGPNNLSGSWAVGCGNTHYYSATITRSNPGSGGSGGGGGGGCPSGQTYCANLNACATSCGGGNPNYTPFNINPNIPATEGPVKLKTLKITPPLVNKSQSCIVSWGDAFDSYDGLTICKFTAPSINLEFKPGSTTAPTSTSITNIQKDTAVKMECGETDGSVASTTAEGVCRLNWAYVEVN